MFMKVQNYSFSINSKGFTDIVDITDRVLHYTMKSGIKNGNVLIFSPGSTCGITTIEYESGCLQDLKEFYDFIAPINKDYRHNQRWDDGNGFSHIRAAFTKSNYIFPIVNGQPVLGTWQQLIYIDFDNKSRNRNIIVQITGE